MNSLPDLHPKARTTPPLAMTEQSIEVTFSETFQTSTTWWVSRLMPSIRYSAVQQNSIRVVESGWSRMLRAVELPVRANRVSMARHVQDSENWLELSNRVRVSVIVTN